MYGIVTTLQKIRKLNKRLRFIQGGTGAAKTVSSIMYLSDLAQRDKEPTITSVVSESLPHLRKGAERNFLDILKTHNRFKDSRWNKTEHTYTFGTGSIIEFFGADQPDKVRGPRRHRLFLNECNNIGYETFTQLETRTREFVIADFNPVAEFWFHEHLEHNEAFRDVIDHLVVTYKDNEALSQEEVAAIERRRSNKSWFRVFGEGLLGEIEGIIYGGWKIIDEIPHEARFEGCGLDFGYDPDPAAIVAVYYLNGGYILDGIVYQKGLSNKQLADVFAGIEKGLVIADSAEPKSIEEIRGYGIHILPTKKGADSKRMGIKYVQNLKISVTKRSTNLIKEYRNYMWKFDRDGRMVMGETDEKCADHCMDAIRYKLTSLIPADQMREQQAGLAAIMARQFMQGEKKQLNPGR